MTPPLLIHSVSLRVRRWRAVVEARVESLNLLLVTVIGSALGIGFWVQFRPDDVAECITAGVDDTVADGAFNILGPSAWF
jgi:hypothetical protein